MLQIETKKENHNAIDLMKFIMAFFVIAIHTGPMSNSTNSIIRAVYNFFSGSAVPFFFLVSGYLLGKKFTHSETDAAIVMQRLKKTVYTYVFWTFVYFPLAAIPWVKYKTPANFAFWGYVRNFFFVGEQYNSWPLWYLLSTIYALMFVWFLLKHNVGLKVIAALGMVLISLSFFIDDFISYSGVMPASLGLIRKVLQSTIVSARVLRGIFYIPMGMLLSQYKIPLWGGNAISGWIWC